jgi:hypothetical protein
VITTARFGTQFEDHDRPWRRHDRAGGRQAELTWDGATLVELVVVGYRGETLSVATATRAPHPVLGPSHPLVLGGRAVAWLSAVDWSAPTAIPAIDRPAALPAGCGTMLLDTIARLAAAAGVRALRYAGPYPTAALWQALGASFATAGDEASFTAAAHLRWGGGPLPTIPIDFAPAPHERLAADQGVTCLARSAIERVIVDGLAFAPGTGVRRMIEIEDGYAAALCFGDRAWAELARVDRDGHLVARRPGRPAEGDPAGQVLPPTLVEPLLAVVAEALPPPLTVDAVGATPIVWGDPGLTAAADRGDRIVLHVGLWHHLAPRGMAAVALAIAEALVPIARDRAIAALARAADA